MFFQGVLNLLFYSENRWRNIKPPKSWKIFESQILFHDIKNERFEIDCLPECPVTIRLKKNLFSKKRYSAVDYDMKC
jgi:hypothetical protein